MSEHQSIGELAVSMFRTPPACYNCAQSVAAAANRMDLIDELSGCGCGRAPGGLCGALHAAMLIAPEDKRSLIREEFVKAVGVDTCREIKSVAKTPCATCVRLAAELATAK